GVAVIGRILEGCGLKVAILPQPNWQDDWRDFKKLGVPKLFFGITAGNMDSMVNHYTANKRLRSDDAYTAGGKAGFRPDYATVVYCNIVKKLYPDVPVVIGGVEASMRRLSHYDYWSDTLKPSVLLDSKADLLVYGMGEKPMIDLVKSFQSDDWRQSVKSCKQVAYVEKNIVPYKEREDVIWLHPYQKELQDKRFYGENFVTFETESNKKIQKILIQPYQNEYLVIQPPYPVATEEETDQFALFDKMMNAPHPKYVSRGEIPAFEMIKNSINIHRGCFGGCSFCAIAAHQGKFVASRSEKSILKEVEDLSHRSYFKGHISDLGGPSANMYQMNGKDETRCKQCVRPSCIFPLVCKNLNIDHHPMINLYRKVQKMEGVKQITIGSGIRYDMLIAESYNMDRENGLSDYLTEVVQHHVSGRLKVAPEHTVSSVLKKMRKPNFDKFLQFLEKFNIANRKSGKKQQLIPYFISSHPGCTVANMAELAIEAKEHHLMTDQVQDFTPTPMTYSTAMYFLGYDPYSKEKVSVAKTVKEKKEQHLFFFYHKKENKMLIQKLLSKMGKNELFRRLNDRRQ
ncbi:MAG: YgiQ family radical SAM protein, partial [Bacteroidales bacterium]